MRVFLIIVLFFAFLNSQIVFPSQNDSLLQSLKKLPKKEQLNILLKNTWKLRTKNSFLALKYGKAAIKLAKEKKDFSKLAEANSFLGVIYRNISKYDSSIVFYNKALKYAQIANDSTQLAYAYNNIGGYNGYKHRYFLALENVFYAKNIFKKINNLRGMAYCNIQAGLWFTILGVYNKAEKYLIEAMQIRQHLNDKFGITVAQSLLADLYYKEGLYDKAQSLYYLTLRKYQKFGDMKGIGASYGGLGGIAYFQYRYGEALAYRLKSLKIFKKLSYKIGIVLNYNGLGVIYNALGKYPKALEYEKKAERQAEEIDYKEGLLKVYKNLILIYKNYDLSKVSDYAIKFVNLQKEISNNEMKTRAEELEKFIESQEILKKNLYLTNALQKSKAIIITGLIIGIVIVFLFIMVYIEYRKRKQKEKELEAALNEKNKLFSIVAHDLKNPFTSILGYSDLVLSDFDNFEKEDLREAFANMRSSSQKLLNMVENILTWARSQSGKLKVHKDKYDLNTLLFKVTSYFTQSAQAKNIDIKLQFEGKPVCYCDKDLFSTAVRNLFNNSIKFTSPGGKIIVSTHIDRESAMAIVIVADTGLGMTEEQLKKVWDVNKESGIGTMGEKGTSLGLVLVKEAVELNGGTISVESEKNVGTEFVFTVPIVNAAEDKSDEEK